MEEEYGCDTLLDIYPYPTLIQFKYYLGGIHHYPVVLGKWIFESNLTFALPLNKDNLEYCCINDNEKKGINCYKVVLK